MQSLQNKLEKIIQGYIPKHTTCRFEEQKRVVLREKEKVSILPGIKEKVERMGHPLEVNIIQEWERQDPDMSVCKACKETIYGVQYQLSILVNGERVEQKRPVKLCEVCYLKKVD